jgi:hypothetical protein
VERICAKLELSDETQRKLESKTRPNDIDASPSGSRPTSMIGIRSNGDFNVCGGEELRKLLCALICVALGRRMRPHSGGEVVISPSV